MKRPAGVDRYPRVQEEIAANDKEHRDLLELIYAEFKVKPSVMSARIVDRVRICVESRRRLDQMRREI